jgi:hypothetical protein
VEREVIEGVGRQRGGRQREGGSQAIREGQADRNREAERQAGWTERS